MDAFQYLGLHETDKCSMSRLAETGGQPLASKVSELGDLSLTETSAPAPHFTESHSTSSKTTPDQVQIPNTEDVDDSDAATTTSGIIDWESVKGELKQFYLEQDKPLREIITLMAQSGFVARY